METAQSDILISVDFVVEIVRDKFEISSIYGCSLENKSNFFSLFMIMMLLLYIRFAFLSVQFVNVFECSALK